jgi:hypothetical protein
MATSLSTPHGPRWPGAPSPRAIRRIRSSNDPFLFDHFHVHDDDVVLAGSELATNALVHTGSGFIVTVHETGPSASRCKTRTRRDPQPEAGADPEGSTGRGLRIVDALARRWGTEPLATGKVVWAEFRLRSGGSP